MKCSGSEIKVLSWHLLYCLLAECNCVEHIKVAWAWLNGKTTLLQGIPEPELWIEIAMKLQCNS